MSYTFKWGIIGPGKIARKFAEAVQNVKGAELYAVGSRSLENAQQYAREFNVTRAYGSYESLVCDPDVDIVYVATPHAFHKEHSILCLENKKAVLCEKPLAHTYNDVREMIAASVEHNTFLMEAMWSRFLPPVNKALELIAKDEIGAVTHLSADFGFRVSFDEAHRLHDLKLGGGSLLDVGVYPLFLALTILGAPSSLEATAKLSPTGADEWFRGVLNYASSRAEIYSSIVEDTARTALITGTKGSIEFVSPWYRQTSLILKKDNGTIREIEFEYSGNGFEPQIMETMKCVREGKIESAVMPHWFSDLQSRVVGELCSKGGIFY